MIYQWKLPNLYNIPAQEAGTEIEHCKNNDGFITPEAVVEKAKPETSVIHGCFEWNDQSAAQRYRLHQAGELIRSIITVTVGEENGQPAAVRAFVNIKGDSERGYKLIHSVVNNHDEYGYLLECAKKELAIFRQKYSTLIELRGVMTAIQEVNNIEGFGNPD